MEEEVTTIQLKISVVQTLKNFKKYSGETYNEIILRFITEAKEAEELGVFVQKAQETKMKELWSEGYYSGWKNA